MGGWVGGWEDVPAVFTGERVLEAHGEAAGIDEVDGGIPCSLNEEGHALYIEKEVGGWVGEKEEERKAVRMRCCRS